MHPTVTVQDPDRAEKFRSVFGTTSVPIKSMIPEYANLPGFDEPQLVYLLDVDRITSEQFARLVAHVSLEFGLPAHEVEHGIIAGGFPILAKGTTTSGRIPNADLHIIFPGGGPGTG